MVNKEKIKTLLSENKIKKNLGLQYDFPFGYEIPIKHGCSVLCRIVLGTIMKSLDYSGSLIGISISSTKPFETSSNSGNNGKKKRIGIGAPPPRKQLTNNEGELIRLVQIHCSLSTPSEYSLFRQYLNESLQFTIDDWCNEFESLYSEIEETAHIIPKLMISATNCNTEDDICNQWIEFVESIVPPLFDNVDTAYILHRLNDRYCTVCIMDQLIRSYEQEREEDEHEHEEVRVEDLSIVSDYVRAIMDHTANIFNFINCQSNAMYKNVNAESNIQIDCNHNDNIASILQFMKKKYLDRSDQTPSIQLYYTGAGANSDENECGARYVQFSHLPSSQFLSSSASASQQSNTYFISMDADQQNLVHYVLTKNNKAYMLNNEKLGVLIWYFLRCLANHCSISNTIHIFLSVGKDSSSEYLDFLDITKIEIYSHDKKSSQDVMREYSDECLVCISYKQCGDSIIVFSQTFIEKLQYISEKSDGFVPEDALLDFASLFEFGNNDCIINFLIAQLSLQLFRIGVSEWIDIYDIDLLSLYQHSLSQKEKEEAKGQSISEEEESESEEESTVVSDAEIETESESEEQKQEITVISAVSQKKKVVQLMESKSSNVDPDINSTHGIAIAKHNVGMDSESYANTMSFEDRTQILNEKKKKSKQEKEKRKESVLMKNSTILSFRERALLSYQHSLKNQKRWQLEDDRDDWLSKHRAKQTKAIPLKSQKSSLLLKRMQELDQNQKDFDNESKWRAKLEERNKQNLYGNSNSNGNGTVAKGKYGGHKRHTSQSQQAIIKKLTQSAAGWKTKYKTKECDQTLQKLRAKKKANVKCERYHTKNKGSAQNYAQKECKENISELIYAQLKSGESTDSENDHLLLLGLIVLRMSNAYERSEELLNAMELVIEQRISKNQIELLGFQTEFENDLLSNSESIHTQDLVFTDEQTTLFDLRKTYILQQNETILVMNDCAILTALSESEQSALKAAVKQCIISNARLLSIQLVHTEGLSEEWFAEIVTVIRSNARLLTQLLLSNNETLSNAAITELIKYIASNPPALRVLEMNNISNDISDDVMVRLFDALNANTQLVKVEMDTKTNEQKGKLNKILERNMKRYTKERRLKKTLLTQIQNRKINGVNTM